MTGIKSNGYSLRCLARFVDIICKTLCCLTNRVNIHTIGSGTNDSTQTSGSKLKIHVKTLFDLIVVICDVLQLLFGILIKVRIAQPLLVDVFVVHVFSSYQ